MELPAAAAPPPAAAPTPAGPVPAPAPAPAGPVPAPAAPVFHTVLRALAVLRTVAPTHYANGGWFDSKECPDTQPLDRDETAVMAEPKGGFYRAQLEEFRAAEGETRKNGVRLSLMDVARIMLRCPDGHPDRYGHSAGEQNGFDIDCLH